MSAATKSHSGERESLLPLNAGAAAAAVKPHKSIILNVCSFILVTEFCERLAYYGLTGSLPIFFHKHLGINNNLAAELNNAFTSLSYLTPLIGAYVADKYLGRFSTIVSFSLLYLAGLALCVVASLPNISSMPLFMLGLFGGVAFGSGGIKPNVVVLGADQFNVDIPEQRAEKDSFFNWFYWAINIGATFSYGVLTNLAVNGLPPYISESYGFFASFFIPSSVFVLSLMVFYCGKNRYRRVPPKGSALNTFFAILMQAGSLSRRGKFVLSGGFSFLPGILLTTISYFVDDPVWHMIFALSGAFSVLYGMVVLIFSGSSTEWIRLASRQKGGSFAATEVKDVMQVIRLSPYLSIIIIFWAVYAQQTSNFVLQGCQMDLRVNRNDTHSTLISSAMLSILDSGVILVFIPIFDKLIYPAMSAMGFQPTLLRKIGTGLFFSFLSMLVAGLVEQYRKHSDLVDGVVSNCGSETEALPMSAISVWWQTPQFLLIGISEILTSISSYDLFYSEVPESMRSVCQALNLLTTTLGYIVAGALNSIFSFWITSDLNDGNLEYIFYVMALLVLLNMIAFVFVSQSFEYHVPPPSDKDVVSGFSPALPRAARRLIGKLRPNRNTNN
uniref:Major facilitator superfamily (MFS) profile domain-containing protein n=1 Tax=Globisporangium ultimum (strain ATCC 200006 / CBS 805.95 / DAOM BR144) TaxID=431595 RepID=K3W8L1_GLOUD